MLEKRDAIDGCVADLEMAKKVFKHLVNGQSASEEQIRKAAVDAKKLEIKLAGAKVAQAEYYLASLSARVDYLEARSELSGGATRAEQEELVWAREALPINATTVARLAAELEQRKRELELLISRPELAAAGGGSES